MTEELVDMDQVNNIKVLTENHSHCPVFWKREQLWVIYTSSKVKQS